jgi:hypothetical protein
VAESTAPVTGHEITLLEHTGFQYMLRGHERLVGGVNTPPKTPSLPLTSVPKGGSIHAVSRHIAPLRDRRSPVAATPQENQISKLNSSRAGKVISNQPTAVPAVAATALRACCAAAVRAPATPANSISRRLRRNSGTCRHQLGAAGPSYNSLGSNPTANPIGGRNLPASRYPALPTRHPAHPNAQPARAGVRSESPNPAERTNKKTAGSYGTGSLDDRPHLLRQQVSARAPITQHFVARAPARARTHIQPPPSHLPIPPPLP